ncbi:ShlB/FhaC/HecB family hemolysin secretion/activation protein [Dyella jejuensis]|uniref:ShlB/FhaC/HecB family hemolysin secretion/activation protein n=2 Tax=Dyella jejuensis TaxID=1432009 RepID=A0ABW8JI01_9GAMM
MTPINRAIPPLRLLCFALSLALGSAALHAQTRAAPVPNSGQLLQEAQPPNALAPSSDLRLEVQQPRRNRADNSQSFPVREIRITGNTALLTATLHALVAPEEGKNLTLADLDDLADRITDAYHAHGYPLATAYVPAQTLQDGIVHIAVVEARYGHVTLQNQSQVADHVLNATLSPLQQGQQVSDYTLERSLLLLTDVPGASVNSVMRPGEQVGTSDLVVDVTSAPRYTGTLGLDDYGNRYTDRLRLSGTFAVNGLFNQGDVLNVSGVSSGAGMSYASAGYKYLLDGQGTVLGIAASDLHYRLGNGLQDLQAHGTAQVQSVNLSQPFIRNTAGNLYGQIEFDHKRLHDDIDIADIETNRHSNVWVATLAGDQRDSSGVTNFNLSGSYGRLYFNNLYAAFADVLGPRTAGSYSKFDYSLSRLQQLSQDNALYVGFSGQKANKNLDTSEQFYLGGPDSVRGYDVGAVSGAQGTLATIEYRHDFLLSPLPGPWQASAFVDSGHVQAYKTPFFPGVNSARLNSVGLGLHWVAMHDWVLSTSVAKPIGNRPVLVGTDYSNAARFWLQVQKGFY